MQSHELSFAKIHILRNDLAEVIVHDGVEMDLEMVHEYHDFLLSNLQSPFSLLINKINSYSYDFEAQENLATLEEIRAMAVVAYNKVTLKTTEGLAEIPRPVEWNLRIFEDRSDALDWLTTG